MFDHGQAQPHMRVLVTGASGAVGSSAVQLLNMLAGVHVIALASSRNHSMLRELNAHRVFDYNSPSWESRIKYVDLVFDSVGGDVLAKSWETVKDDGTIITVGDPAPAWAFGSGPAAESTDRPGVRYLISFFLLMRKGWGGWPRLMLVRLDHYQSSHIHFMKRWPLGLTLNRKIAEKNSLLVLHWQRTLQMIDI